VPARPARGCPRESSPRHHQEHRTTGMYTHTRISIEKHRRHHREPARCRDQRRQRGDSRAGSSSRSPQRGGGRWNLLVEMEEGSEESNSSKVVAMELAGVGQDRQATARVTRVRQRGTRGRERWREWEEAVWAGSVWPTQIRAWWASRLGGQAWPLGQDHVLFLFFFFLFL
jgi:hypothetical protein